MGISPRPGRAANYAWRRFSRSYPIYWILTSAVLIPALILPGLVQPEKLTVPSITQEYLLLEVGQMVGLPLIPPAWSLFHEIKFYILFLLLILLPRRISTVFVTALLGLSVANFISMVRFNNRFSASSAVLLQHL